jgi:hypothetical protein
MAKGSISKSEWARPGCRGVTAKVLLLEVQLEHTRFAL